jgi:hypothetical protein
MLHGTDSEPSDTMASGGEVTSTHCPLGRTRTRANCSARPRPTGSTSPAVRTRIYADREPLAIGLPPPSQVVAGNHSGRIAHVGIAHLRQFLVGGSPQAETRSRSEATRTNRPRSAQDSLMLLQWPARSGSTRRTPCTSHGGDRNLRSDTEGQQSRAGRPSLHLLAGCDHGPDAHPGRYVGNLGVSTHPLSHPSECP